MSWEEQSGQRKKGAGRRSQSGREAERRKQEVGVREWEGSREGSRKRKEAGSAAVSPS